VALSENELDVIIKNSLSKKLDATIEVPDIDSQWNKIKQQIVKTEGIPTKQKKFLSQKRVVVAATIVITIGSITFLYPNNANALGGKIGEFIDYIVGKTTQNKVETYKQVDDPDMPKIQNLGTNIEEEVTIEQAQSLIPFKLAIPSYLPSETNTRRVTLTSFGADVYQISIEYDIKDRAILLSQQNSSSGTSRGTLYDTDDTVVKDLIVNGNPAILFMSKNGLNTLNWQLRGLLLQIKGEITEEEIIKIANSIN